MPDPPLEKRRPLRGAVRSAPPAAEYAELHCRTNFSFLEGASHPDELVHRATELGYRALAITDRNSLGGVVRAHVAARETGLKLLIGAHLTPLDGPEVVLYATDRAAYGRLARLITTGRRRAEKGDCQLTVADLAAHASGLIAAVFLGPSPGGNTMHHTCLQHYRDIFQQGCYLLAELHVGSHDCHLLANLLQLGTTLGLPVVAANDVHYHIPRRQPLQDVLTAIRQGCTVAELGKELHSNGQRYLKSPRQMSRLFAACPDILRHTVTVAEQCDFSLDELRYEYPRELSPTGITPFEYLTQLVVQGSAEHYPQGVPDKIKQLIEHELQLIEELQYEAYFLTVWDLVRFARSRDILCQGRGSAANSVVCYCLGITSVSPDHINVLFERFISKERNEAPDIDVDFEHERREEVLQYLYQKYGRERAGLAATVITYRPRSAVRDVGKALGFSLDRVDKIAKSLGSYSSAAELNERFQDSGLDPEAKTTRQFAHLAEEILEFPRHLSQHVGGMVITEKPLCELVPLENAAMPDRTVVQWDKDDLEALGLLKVDCLALGMLTAIQKAFRMLEHSYGQSHTLASIPAEDSAVYDMIQRADTIGVFQIESRAQMSMLPRLKPRCYYDLVIEVSIVRPGPIQGDMVHPYLRRRAGKEKVEYPNPEIKEVLERTLGVPIFQEQAMRLAVVAAGFTPGEADQLRRAMGAWRRPGIIDRFRQKLIEGMLARGYSSDFALRLFKQIRGFGEYGFPESHAASFARLVYVSSWLKKHYPAVFTASLLNSQPMGFYAPAQLVADARKHDISVLPVDVNFSDWDTTLEPQSSKRDPYAIRLGFRMVEGLRLSHAERLLEARRDQPFQSFEELVERTGLASAVLQRLAKADAFSSLALQRRAAFWKALPAHKQYPLFPELDRESEASLPIMELSEEVAADYRSVHLSLRGHPLQFIRELLQRHQVKTAANLPELKPGRRYRVAGLVLMRQRPSTAKGITFVTLEDETGTVNLIVRQEVWERHHTEALRASVLLAEGNLQHEHRVIHLLVDRLQDISPLLREVESRSRDFR